MSFAVRSNVTKKPIVKVVETVVGYKEDYTVNLKLDKNEAETLLMIVRRIGGSPYTTRRKFADNISKSLRNAGVLVDGVGCGYVFPRFVPLNAKAYARIGIDFGDEDFVAELVKEEEKKNGNM